MMDDGTPAGGLLHERETEVLRRELERRLAILDDADEDRFGSFTPLDWAICVLFFVIIPILAVWWFA